MLNDNGIDQARKVNSAWKEQLAFDIPLPESLFSSPMRRAGMTLQETWHDILLDKGVRPRVSDTRIAQLCCRCNADDRSWSRCGKLLVFIPATREVIGAL
jgi:hypothetical protein